MNFSIKTLTLNDFKGISNRVVNFTDKTEIEGQNGAGKTSIADAIYWVFADKDYSLNSNPMIRPNDGRECTVEVTLDCEMDGRPIQIKKSQKQKVTEKDGIRKVALTNTYEVNAVPMAERDFKEKLSELGFDFDKFLPLSHPDCFLAGMNEKKARTEIRNTLFEMAGTYTDLEIAQKFEDVNELVDKLQIYSVAEIEAMANAVKRKIAENYGKKGEILNSKIEGLELAKTDVDTAELELEISGYKEEIARLDDYIATLEQQADAGAYEEQIMCVKFEQSDIEKALNKSVWDRKAELLKIVDNGKADIFKEESKKRDNEYALSRAKEKLDLATQKIASLTDEYNAVKKSVFAGTSAICPTCGREYPDEKKAEIKTKFEEGKTTKINLIADTGKTERAKQEEAKAEIESLTAEITARETSINELREKVSAAQNEYSELKDVDVTTSEEWQTCETKLAALHAEVDKAKAKAAERDEAIQRKNTTLEALKACEIKLAKTQNNIEIDEKILQLRADQRKYEQDKADCEKIEYMLKALNQHKNELATEDINKHFHIVKWRLFDYQKNGEVVDDCTPIIDGKDYNFCANNGLKTLAKIDIVSSMQEYFKQSYPIVLDECGNLTSVTTDRINVAGQLIMLKPTEDKELIVK